MKNLFLLLFFVSLFFNVKSQIVIVHVYGGYEAFANGVSLRTYYADGTYENNDFPNVTPEEAMAAVVNHLNGITNQGYKLIKIQDVNDVSTEFDVIQTTVAESSVSSSVSQKRFPLESTVYYFAVP